MGDTDIGVLAASNYFDDFVSIAAMQETSSVDYTIKTVFRLLGKKFAGDGLKAFLDLDSATTVKVVGGNLPKPLTMCSVERF